MTPDDLVELEAIKRLKYKYLRCLDQKLWDELGTCFTADAVSSYSDGAYSYDGRDAILGFLRKALGDPSLLTAHRIHQPEIDLTSATTAVATWALEDVVIVDAANLTIRGAAFYRDEYVKVDGQWLIKSTGYSRTYEQHETRDGIKLTAPAPPAVSAT